MVHKIIAETVYLQLSKSLIKLFEIILLTYYVESERMKMNKMKKRY